MNDWSFIRNVVMVFLLGSASICAEQEITTIPANEVWPQLGRLKELFGSSVIGAELYSPLTFPTITAEDSKESAKVKLKKAGFAVLEKDGTVNIIDASERATGKRP